jgi:uncharacterized protein
MNLPSSSGFLPASAGERAEWLDALRGFALLGIVLINVQVFSGYVFRGPISTWMPVQHAWDSLDPALDFAVHALVQGKFYSLFAFLFGLGFALQLRRAEAMGAQAMSMMHRRLAWLLVFGLAHALLVWFGDILTVYAVFGFALLWFRHLSQRALLRWALFFLASPVLIYMAFIAVGLGDPLAGDPATPPGESFIVKATRTIATGSYLDVVQTQWQFYPGGWIRRALRLALPRIFGMFLLGMWAARTGLPLLREAQRAMLLRCMLRRWLLWGVMLGLPLNIGFTALGGGEALLPASASGLLAVVMASLGMPLLCLACIAAFALYWSGSRPGSLLVAAGRTALSHYLGQSVLCVGVFYGYGFGFFGRVSYTVALPIAIAVFVLLALLGRAWLRRFPQGPMESLWRRLSYRRPLSRGVKAATVTVRPE